MNRVSNLVRRIAGYYGAACARSILTACLCLMLWSGAARAGPDPLICALVPHFKDEYWLSVGYGLEREAARQGARLLLYEAGGYRSRATQIAQLRSCAARGADAILIGAVTSDHPDLVEAVAAAAKVAPVFGLVNALDAGALSGHGGVDWRDMGRAVGRYLARRHPAGSPPQSAVLLSGPPEAGWSALLESGLRAGLKGSAVAIVETYGADTGLRQQFALVETALARHPEADYLIGSAPAIEAAMGLRAARPDGPDVRLISTYISHTVLRGLMNGSVEAAPFDDPMLQGTMAIRQALGSGKGAGPAASAGPDIVLLTSQDPRLGSVRISPPEYFPAIQ